VKREEKRGGKGRRKGRGLGRERCSATSHFTI